MTSDLTVAISGVACSITSVTDKQITCINGKKAGIDFSDISVKVTYQINTS